MTTTVELSEDTCRLLAQAREPLGLSQFATLPETIIASAHAAISSRKTAISHSFGEQHRWPHLHQSKRREPWPPKWILMVGDRPVDPGRDQIGLQGNAISMLARLNPQDNLQKMYDFCKVQAGERGRLWVARSHEGIYPNNPNPANPKSVQAKEIPHFPGWWYGTNYDIETKLKMIEQLCRLLGVSFKVIKGA